MLVVIDTNVIFSALYNLKSDAGRLLIFAVEGKINLASPTYVKGELERNLKEKLDYTDEELKETIKALPIEWKEVEKAVKLIRHDRDVPVLALAMHLGVGVVSGDKHFQGISEIKLWSLNEIVK
ncbi:MAG: putative toxin-antitoxin system toxin component, PIN family [Candidatus Hydrothermarchaeaceae archaeon]